MCGRFTLRTPPTALVKAFGLRGAPELRPRFNIAPTQSVAAIRETTGERELFLPRWGLIPSWAKDPKIGNQLINARAETVATKPAFRAAFKSRRCLVVADGYFEWRTVGKRKQPLFIHRGDHAPFAFAGLWERWGEPRLETCTIVTTAASESMQPVHSRMPVVLPPDSYARWLDPRIKEVAELSDLLQIEDSAADWLVEPVDPIVNSPRYDGPECIRPASDEPSAS